MDGRNPNKHHSMKYEDALHELENIVQQMENNDLDIDQLTQQLQRAKLLIRQCKKQLTKTNEEIQQLLNDETAEQQ